MSDMIKLVVPCDDSTGDWLVVSECLCWSVAATNGHYVIVRGVLAGCMNSCA